MMSAIDWASGVSGDWTTAADWTGGVAPGAGDDVTTGVAGTFTVTISSPDAAHSLTLDNATATVVDSGSLALGASLDLAAGTFELDIGAQISGGTMSAGGGVFLANGGTLDDVTFDGVLDVSGPFGLDVSDTLTVKGAKGVGNGVVDVADSGINFETSQSFNNVTVNISDGGISTEAQLTLGVNLVIHQDGKIAGIFASNREAAVINRGMIEASYAGGSFSIGYAYRGAFTNFGTIAVSNGDTLTLGGAWSNKGSISATDATVVLSGTFTYADLGTISLTNSAVVIGASEESRGVLNNTGATLHVGTGTKLGSVTLAAYGTILGGTLVDTGSGLVFGAGDGGGRSDFSTLDDVTFDGALDLTGADLTVGVAGPYGLVVKNPAGAGEGVVNITGDRSYLSFEGNQLFDNATVNIGGASDFAAIVDADSQRTGATLTLGVDLTIDQVGRHAGISAGDYPGDLLVNQGKIDASYRGGQFDVGSLLYFRGGSFVNEGTITVADGDRLTIVGVWSNTGTITASGAAVVLDGAFTTASLENMALSQSSLRIGGALNNAGSTLEVGTGTRLGRAVLTTGGTISGGTVANEGDGIAFDRGTLDAVTFEGPLNLANLNSFVQVSDLILRGEGGVGDGVLNLTGEDSTIDFASSQTLDNATVNIGASYGALMEATGTLTLGVDLTINQTGRLASITVIGYRAVLENQGAINASYAGGSLDIAAPSFANAGTIDVSNGDAVIFASRLSAATLGAVDVGAGGGVLDFAGTLKNRGGTLVMSAGEVLEGAITRGTIIGAFVARGLDLKHVTAEGAIDVDGDDAQLTISSGLTMTGAGGVGPGAIDLTGDGAILWLREVQSLGGASLEIGANDGGYASVIQEAVKSRSQTLTLDLAVDQTGQRARILGASATGEAIVNAGTIRAGYEGGDFTIIAQTFVNSGSIEVSNGDTLAIDTADGSNTGTITATDATVDFEGLFTLGSFVETRSALTVSGDLDAGARLSIGAGSSLTLAAGAIDAGTVGDASAAVIIGYGTLDARLFDAGAVEAMGGTLELGQMANGAGSLDIGAGATLRADAFVAATLGAVFDGDGGVLALASPAAFKATLSGFASGDMIDLLGKAATGATLEDGDELLVTDGAHTVATLRLAGDYSGDSFAVASDSHGGTNITVTTAPAARFVQAMSALSAPSASAARGAGEAPRPHPTMLANPRVMIA